MNILLLLVFLFLMLVSEYLSAKVYSYRFYGDAYFEEVLTIDDGF